MTDNAAAAPPPTPPKPTKTYRANCHCGAFIYTVAVPEIDKVSFCDCSFCSKRAILWTFLSDPDTQFSIIKGNEDDLAVYQFATHAFEHKSCKTCGSFLFSRWATGPPGYNLLINTRCFQDFDTWEMPVEVIPGHTFGDPYQPPQYNGPEPAAKNIKNARVYHGSCHCGDVKLAFKTEPLLPHTTQVRECNCSICQRNGYLWLYPEKDQVAMTGAESLASYTHASGTFVKTFCRRCGCPVQNTARELSADEIAALDQGVDEELFNRLKALELVNVRLLHGVDVEKLKKERFPGWKIPPTYVNP